MPFTDEEFQRYLDAGEGIQQVGEQKKPERFEYGSESADSGISLDNPAVRTVLRGAQNIAQDAYNIGYDAIASIVGGDGIDMESATLPQEVRIGEDNEFEYRPQLVRGTEPLLGGVFGGEVRERPGFGGGTPSRSIMPTRNYYKLNPDGKSHQLVTRDAPLPFIGRVERISTGDDLLDMSTDFVSNILQLVMIAGSNKGALATKVSPNIARLASAANRPSPFSVEGYKKAGAVLAKGFQEYSAASVVQSLIRASGNPKAETALGTFIEPMQINPSDPLLVRQSKVLAEELLINMPVGAGMELGFYGLNTIRRATGDIPKYAGPLKDKLVNVTSAALRFYRAQVLGEAKKIDPPAPVTDPQVKVITGAERREARGAQAKLAEMQRVEDMRDRAGITRPEEFEQPELQPLSDEEIAAIQDRAREELVAETQKFQTEIAKIETTVTPGVAESPDARPELQRPDYDQVATLPRQEIFAAPKALQYKAAGQVTKSGASGVLSDAARYNPNLAGTILAWRDVAGEIDANNPGRIYAVDGHNRLDLANRLGYEGGVNVQFIDAPDVATARTIGAMSNIANANGTPTDAAKVLRDTGMSIEEMSAMGVAPSGSVARIAVGLRDLPQDLFDKVVAGDVSEEIGSAIGRGNLPEQVQRDILSVALKKRWGVERVREAVLLGNEATVTTEIDTGVIPGLGLEELTSSDFQKMLDMRIHVRGRQKTKIRALGAVTDAGKADTLVDAGNVLDVEQSKTAREAAIYGERIFNQMAGMTGPLNDLLKEMVGKVGKGKTVSAVAREYDQRVSEVLESYVNNDLIPKQAARKAAQLQAEQAVVDGQPIPEVPSTDAPAGGILNQVQLARLQGLDVAGREAERVKLKKMVLGARAKTNRETKLAQLEAQDAKNLEYLDDMQAMDDGELSVEDFEAKYGAGSATSEEPAVFASKPGEYTKVKRALDQDRYARAALEVLDGAVTEPAAATRTTATPDEIRRNITDIINKARADLPQDKRDELIEQIVNERMTKGAIVSNPSAIGGRTIPQLPDAEPRQPAKPQVVEYDDVDRLPKRLEGARANAANTELLFESDVDKAIYIATSKNPSKRRDDFLEWLDSIGIPEETIEGTGIRIRERLKQARIYNNPTAPKKLHLKDFGAQQTSGSLSGEIDFGPDAGGRIGELHTEQLRVRQADQVDLMMVVQKIAGPINVEFREQMNLSMDAAQAKAYNVPVGTKIRAAGIYSPDTLNPARDVIILAEGSGGRLYDFDMRKQIAFHEAFHRIQQRFLTDKEREILKNAMPELRQLAAKYHSGLRQKILSGRMSDIEVQAIAFQAMADNPKIVTQKKTWRQPLQKLLDIADRVNNWLQGRGYRTWNDVFEMAESGEMAATREPSQYDRSALAAYAVPDLDPEEAAKEFSGKRLEGDEAIRTGEITVNEALVNETRRGISRSGKTRYVEKDQDKLAASYYALRRVLNENMKDLTGIPEFKDSDIAQRALEHLASHDGPQEVIEGLERLLKAASPESGDHVVALTALQMMRDNAQNAARLHSIEYENAVDPVFKAKELEGMVMSFGELKTLDRHYRRVMRTVAQMLRVGKNKVADAALELQLPPLQKLRLNGSADRIESVLSKGFTKDTVSDGLMGEGIYMTTDASTRMDWGDSQAVGSITSDVKIMDLYTAGKRISDLLRELDLGQVLKDGKGFKLSDEQIVNIRLYAQEKGFDGIRYHGDYKPGENPFDEVILFNKETADRVIDADAAVDPDVAAINESVGEGISTALTDHVEPMQELLKPELLEKIKAGSDDPEVKEFGDLMSHLVRQEPAVQMQIADLIDKGGKGSVDRDYIFEAYRGAILFSGQTWWKMGMGTAYRTLTTPIAETAGYTITGALQKLQGKDHEAYLSMRRATLAPLQLQQYLMNVPNAFRMAFHALKENRSFGRVGYAGGQDFDDAIQQSFAAREANDGSQILQEVDFSDPNSGNMASHLMHALGVATTPLRQGGRVSSSIDTFFNYMVGPAANTVKNLDEFLVVAETQHKLKGRAAYDWAWQEAMAKTKQQFVDVHLANGTVIKDGAITGSAVDEVLDYINFSDKMRITKDDVAPRTYERGIAIARERGLTDSVEIHRVALEHMNSTPGWAANMATLTNTVGSRQLNKIHRNAFGKWFFPIMKTPVNIVKAGARAFGYGIFVDTWWKDMLSENPATRARAIGEIAVGWGTFALVNQLIDGGVIEVTGANPITYERNQFNEIVQTPGFSVRVNTPDGPTDWHSVQALDTLTTVLGIVGRVRADADLLTEQQLEEQSAGAIMLLGQVFKSVGADGITRDVFGSLDELLTYVQTMTNVDSEGGNLGERALTSTSRLLARKGSSFVPAFLRNLQNDATEMRFRADRNGYTNENPLDYVNDLLNQMRASVEVQLPGINDQPAILDPITGFPVHKASSSDAFMGETEKNKWIGAVAQQALPHAAFKSVAGNDHMPVHMELERLQRHTTKNIVFYTRNNLSTKIDGETINIGNLDSRGLRPTQRDVNEIINIGANVKINGKNLEQALNDLIHTRTYQNLSPRRSGIRGEEQDSPRLLMIYEVFTKYRRQAVYNWLTSTPRGNEFLMAHQAKLKDEREQDFINEQRRLLDLEAAERSRAIVERDLAQSEAAASEPQGGRLEREIGSFTAAVGLG